MLLALKAALGDDSVTAIHEAGASFVLYDEIYQVACTSYSKSISVNGKLVQQELAASEAFISSAQHVIDQLVLWSGDFRGNSDKLITLTTCHATSSCQLLAAPRSQTAIQAFISPFQNLLAVFSVVVPWLNAIVSTALAQRSDDRPGLYIGKRILAVQQAVQHQTQVDSAAPLVSLAVDVYQKALQSNDKQFASSRVMPFLPYLTQMEKLTLARCAPQLSCHWPLLLYTMSCRLNPCALRLDCSSSRLCDIQVLLKMCLFNRHSLTGTVCKDSFSYLEGCCQHDKVRIRAALRYMLAPASYSQHCLITACTLL